MTDWPEYRNPDLESAVGAVLRAVRESRAVCEELLLRAQHAKELPPPAVSGSTELQRLRQVEMDYRALALCIGADPDHPADEVFEVALDLWREMKALAERSERHELPLAGSTTEGGAGARCLMPEIHTALWDSFDGAGELDEAVDVLLMVGNGMECDPIREKEGRTLTFVGRFLSDLSEAVQKADARGAGVAGEIPASVASQERPSDSGPAPTPRTTNMPEVATAWLIEVVSQALQAWHAYLMIERQSPLDERDWKDGAQRIVAALQANPVELHRLGPAPTSEVGREAELADADQLRTFLVDHEAEDFHHDALDRLLHPVVSVRTPAGEGAAVADELEAILGSRPRHDCAGWDCANCHERDNAIRDLIASRNTSAGRVEQREGRE